MVSAILVGFLQVITHIISWHKMSWSCKKIQHGDVANYIHKFSLKEDKSNWLK